MRGLLVSAVLFASLGAQAAPTPVFIDARDYGARGDGKADDTDALQRALDAAGVAGRTVLLPTGQYLISRPLRLPRNVDLVGQGMGFASEIVPVKCDGLRVVGRDQPGGAAFRNRIEGIAITMTAARPQDTGIVVQDAYSLVVREVFVYEAGRGISIRDSAHVTLDSISVYGKAAGGSTGIEIEDGIVSAYNIDVESVERGLVVRGRAGRFGNVSLFGGYFERFGQQGVLIDGATSVSLFGTFVVAQAAVGATPLVVRPGPGGSSGCSGIVVAGGTYAFDTPQPGRKAIDVAAGCRIAGLDGSAGSPGDARPARR